MAEPGEGAPKKNVRHARQQDYRTIDNARGADGDSMVGKNRERELPEISDELAKAAARDLAVRNLKGNRFGIGQVNTEQPKTGGKVEPDERDGVRH